MPALTHPRSLPRSAAAARRSRSSRAASARPSLHAAPSFSFSWRSSPCFAAARRVGAGNFGPHRGERGGVPARRSRFQQRGVPSLPPSLHDAARPTLTPYRSNAPAARSNCLPRRPRRTANRSRLTSAATPRHGPPGPATARHGAALQRPGRRPRKAFVGIAKFAGWVGSGRWGPSPGGQLGSARLGSVPGNALSPKAQGQQERQERETSTPAGAAPAR